MNKENSFWTLAKPNKRIKTTRLFGYDKNPKPSYNNYIKPKTPFSPVKLNTYPARTKTETRLIDRKPWSDSDKDKVPNIFDCKPLNRRKQGKRFVNIKKELSIIKPALSTLKRNPKIEYKMKQSIGEEPLIVETYSWQNKQDLIYPSEKEAYYGRDTGHFGTGIYTYPTKRKAQLQGYIYERRKMGADASKTLLKIPIKNPLLVRGKKQEAERGEIRGWQFHDALRDIESINPETMRVERRWSNYPVQKLIDELENEGIKGVTPKELIEAKEEWLITKIKPANILLKRRGYGGIIPISSGMDTHSYGAVKFEEKPVSSKIFEKTDEVKSRKKILTEVFPSKPEKVLAQEQSQKKTFGLFSDKRGKWTTWLDKKTGKVKEKFVIENDKDLEDWYNMNYGVHDDMIDLDEEDKSDKPATLVEDKGARLFPRRNRKKKEDKNKKDKEDIDRIIKGAYEGKLDLDKLEKDLGPMKKINPKAAKEMDLVMKGLREAQRAGKEKKIYGPLGKPTIPSIVREARRSEVNAYDLDEHLVKAFIDDEGEVTGEIGYKPDTAIEAVRQRKALMKNYDVEDKFDLKEEPLNSVQNLKDQEASQDVVEDMIEETPKKSSLVSEALSSMESMPDVKESMEKSAQDLLDETE